MKNSVALATGASQEIGGATAIRLARGFSAAVLAACNATELEEVAATVKEAGAEPLPFALDVSRPDAPDTVINAVVHRVQPVLIDERMKMKNLSAADRNRRGRIQIKINFRLRHVFNS